MGQSGGQDRPADTVTPEPSRSCQGMSKEVLNRRCAALSPNLYVLLRTLAAVPPAPNHPNRRFRIHVDDGGGSAIAGTAVRHRGYRSARRLGRAPPRCARTLSNNHIGAIRDAVDRRHTRRRPLPRCRRRPTLLVGDVVCQADGLATRWPILSAGRSVSHVNRHAARHGDASSPTIRFMTAGSRLSPRWSRESGDRSRWVRAGALVRASEEYTLHEHYQRAQRHHDELHR